MYYVFWKESIINFYFSMNIALKIRQNMAFDKYLYSPHTYNYNHMNGNIYNLMYIHM